MKIRIVYDPLNWQNLKRGDWFVFRKFSGRVLLWEWY
jgi:hypothetical protein